MDVNNETVMRELTAMVVQQFTQEIASKARLFATILPEEMSGRDALMGFAEAIEKKNDLQFERKKSD